MKFTHSPIAKRCICIIQTTFFILFISSYIIIEAIHRNGYPLLNIQPFPSNYSNILGTLRPNFSATVFWDPRNPYSYSTTRQGFRSNANSKQIGCDADTSILCLGDSFTFGVGVPDKASFPAALERSLTARNNPHRVKTINVGTPGTGLNYQIQHYNDRLRNTAHEIIISQFYYFNIGHILRGAHYVQKDEPNAPTYHPIKNFILADDISSWLNTKAAYVNALNPIHSFISTQDQFKTPLTSEKPSPSLPFPVTDEMNAILSNSSSILDERNLQTLEPLWNIYLSKLLAFHNAVKQSGKDFLFLIIPDKTQLGSYLNAPSAIIPQFLDAHGIKYIDFTQTFRALYTIHGISPFLDHDFHCNETGNNIIAETIAAHTTFSAANQSIGISPTGNSKPRRYHAPRSLTLTMSDAGEFFLSENDLLTLTESSYDNTHVKREAGGGIRYLTTNTDVGAPARIDLYFTSKKPISQITAIFVPHVTGSDSTQNRLDVTLSYGNTTSSFSTSQLSDLRRHNNFDNMAFLEGAPTSDPASNFVLSIHLLRDAGICYGDTNAQDTIRRIELYLYESERIE